MTTDPTAAASASDILIAKMKRVDAIRRLYAKGLPSGKTGKAQVRRDVTFLCQEIEDMLSGILFASEHLHCGLEGPQTLETAIRHALASLHPYAAGD